MNRLVRGLVMGAWWTTFSVVGCSLIVSNEVPDFKCASAARSSCPNGMVCDLSSGRCVVDGGATTSSGGEEAGDEDVEMPDVIEPTDTNDGAPTGNPGDPCRVDGDCQSKLCGQSAHLTQAITGKTGPICTTTCCSSAECPASFVCFNGGTGGGYCVPGAIAQRTVPATGGKQAGATCSGNADCRSGLCQSSRCVDTCCAPSDCAAGSVCRLKSVSLLTNPTPAHVVWVCAAQTTGATGNAGDACTNQTDCRTDLCLPSGNGSCRPPCSGTAACRSVPGFDTGYCIYGTDAADQFKYCLKVPSGVKILGATCGGNSDCESGFCDPETKKCAEVCAREADCTALQDCRPANGGTPLLRCVAK